MSVKEKLATVKDKIAVACKKSNRDPKDITIIGVTKYVTIDRTKEAIEAGIKNIGENRSEELVHKHAQIEEKANWHFIGTLQSRKVRDIVDKVTAIHSLDRISVVRQISNRSTSPLDCFVQVNVSGEESKHGLKPEAVLPFIKEVAEYDNVRVVGLMTMAPHIEDETKLRAVFKELALLRDQVRDKDIENVPCEYLSMGMSNDYEIAIEEGATHIRIGSKLVGSE